VYKVRPVPIMHVLVCDWNEVCVVLDRLGMVVPETSLRTTPSAEKCIKLCCMHIYIATAALQAMAHTVSCVPLASGSLLVLVALPVVAGWECIWVSTACRT
jgi:hypothetical protein